MDHKDEYHDPDYPDAPARVKEEPPSLSEEEKITKVKAIVRREFCNEIEVRENEIMLIDQRMSTARRMLHRLRYSVVSSYYRDQKLQLSNSQVQDEVAAQNEPRARAEVSAILRGGQRRLHPSVRKLLGKQTVDLEEIFRSRAPRNKTRKDYSAMLQSRNYTIAADATKTLRPDSKPEVEKQPSAEDPSTSRPKKVPRHLEPRLENVLTLDEITRNKKKHRYRIIIGNTSKYCPPASHADRSTHKWLLYVRGFGSGGGGSGDGGGDGGGGDLSAVVRAVTVRLHHTYAPHHTVHIDKPPYHVSRRGWGEFPARVELHFALPDVNRPALVHHTIKLDRNYTGLQTLGGETVVDVWLYSTQEMLEYEYKEDQQIEVQTKQEPKEPEPESMVTEDISTTEKTDNWLDFFTADTTELDVDEMIIKPVKKENNDENNDLDNLIESNIITKDVKEELLENNCLLNKNMYFDGQNYNFDYSHVKSEPYDWSDNYKTIEAPSENVPNEILSQPTSPKKKIMKYMDPTTGKIYYLEVDRNLDLSKVQEIVINSKGNVKTAKISPVKPTVNGLKNVKKNPKKGGISLLKPEVKNLLKNENNSAKIEKQKSVLKSKNNYTHIENDHCYLGAAWAKNVSFSNLKENTVLSVDKSSTTNSVVSEIVVKKEKSLHECLCEAVACLPSMRVAVNYLLKKIPLISDEARDPDYLKFFPFSVENEDKYWKLDFSKRRNIEWSRAKLINKILLSHFKQTEQVWRTKQILIFSRLHGYYPVRQEKTPARSDANTDQWSSWTDLENSRKLESNIKEIYPDVSDICNLSLFDSKEFLCQEVSDTIELVDSDEEVEVVSDVPVVVKREASPETNGGLMLPVDRDEDRLKFLYIERKCADIGVELRNEDVGNGYSYSAVHSVMLSAMKCFAEELIRNALAVKHQEGTSAELPPPVWVGGSARAALRPHHVRGAAAASRLHALTARCVASRRAHAHAHAHTHPCPI